MVSSGLPVECWPLAVSFAVLVLNLSDHKALGGKCPHQKFLELSGKSPQQAAAITDRLRKKVKIFGSK